MGQKNRQRMPMRMPLPSRQSWRTGRVLQGILSVQAIVPVSFAGEKIRKAQCVCV